MKSALRTKCQADPLGVGAIWTSVSVKREKGELGAGGLELGKDLMKRVKLFWRGRSSSLEANGEGSLRCTIFSNKRVYVLMLTVRLWSTS